MGLLEDLEREAQLKQEDDRLAAAERAEQAEYFRSQVRPAMAQIFGYLKELTRHLNYLNRQIQVRYTIPRYAVLEASIDPDYKITVSKDESQIRIQISLEAKISKESAPVVELQGRQTLEDMESFLSQRGLSAKQSTHYDDAGEICGASVQVFGKIQMRGIIDAVVNSPTICFQFTNFEILGASSREIRPEQIDDLFLDRFGRYMARQDDAYLREDLDTGVRDSLRAQIRRNERLRWAELSREKDPKPALKGRLLSQLHDLSRRLSGKHD